MEAQRKRRERDRARHKPPRLPTVADVILMALHAATGDMLADSVFPESEIVVLAWKAATDRLGMAGYRDVYPDAKRVSAELIKMQRAGGKDRDPSHRKGLMTRAAPCRWMVTDAGLERLRELLKKGRAA